MRPKRMINEVKKESEMKKLYQTGVALLAAALLSPSAWAGEGPKGHSHDEAFSAGEPGNGATTYG